MARALARTSAGEHAEITVRMPERTDLWTQKRAATQDTSRSVVISQVLEDERTLWGIPPEEAKVLRADAKALGLELSLYIRYLLGDRLVKLRGAKR